MEPFKLQRISNPTLLYWLLEEPLLYAARLDITNASMSLTKAFVKAEVVTLRQLMSLAGPDFIEVDAVATQLGFRSTRVVEKILRKIQTILTVEETDLLKKHGEGEITPNDKDFFQG